MSQWVPAIGQTEYFGQSDVFNWILVSLAQYSIVNFDLLDVRVENDAQENCITLFDTGP